MQWGRFCVTLWASGGESPALNQKPPRPMIESHIQSLATVEIEELETFDFEDSESMTDIEILAKLNELWLQIFRADSSLEEYTRLAEEIVKLEEDLEKERNSN